MWIVNVSQGPVELHTLVWFIQTYVTSYPVLAFSFKFILFNRSLTWEKYSHINTIQLLYIFVIHAALKKHSENAERLAPPALTLNNSSTLFPLSLGTVAF